MVSMQICLVLPPLTQLNTPYPSISYLARHLRRHQWSCTQRDLGIELFLKVVSRQGLTTIFEELETREELPEEAWIALARKSQHLAVVDAVIAFLQGQDSTLARRLLQASFLPSGPRLEAVDDTVFGPMNQEDAARYRASLYLADLVDLIRACVDVGFELNRYQHHIALGQTEFDALETRLSQTNFIDECLDSLADSIDADVVCLSVPFPGNLYGALRIGGRLKSRGVEVLLGGGYVNTELRDVQEPRLWDYVDALFYDDGEGPLCAWLVHKQGGVDRRHRTLTSSGAFEHSVTREKSIKVADYEGLDLSLYIQLIDTLNPAHRLWGDGRWNKITLAHGCYWKKCAFCDIQLDYISHYEPGDVGLIVDQMEEVIQQTGQTGFHMVDEAAPPRVMRALAEEIIARDLTISWWGNVRFEPAFDVDLCRLLERSGLLAVTGGLEVASDRLLRKMDKGIDVDQVVNVAAAFKSAGVMVHAYLMYGFPTQTMQEGIDAMDVVRQMFALQLLDSAFWHRFVLTQHSGVMRDPSAYGVQPEPESSRAFARNDLRHTEPGAPDWDLFDQALPLALGDWMQGRGLQTELSHYFGFKIPETTIAADRVESVLGGPHREKGRFLWIGQGFLESEDGLVLFGTHDDVLIQAEDEVLEWLVEILENAKPGSEVLTVDEAFAVFPGDEQIFRAHFLEAIRDAGLLVL